MSGLLDDLDDWFGSPKGWQRLAEDLGLRNPVSVDDDVVTLTVRLPLPRMADVSPPEADEGWHDGTLESVLRSVYDAWRTVSLKLPRRVLEALEEYGVASNLAESYEALDPEAKKMWEAMFPSIYYGDGDALDIVKAVLAAWRYHPLHPDNVDMWVDKGDEVLGALKGAYRSVQDWLSSAPSPELRSSSWNDIMKVIDQGWFDLMEDAPGYEQKG